MTTSMKTRVPVLHTSDHLIASIPFLLGFHPTNSVVLMWLSHGKVQLTQRVDVIASRDVGTNVNASPDDLHSWADEVASAVRNIVADQVVITVFLDSPPEHSGWCDSLVAGLCRSVIDRDIYLMGAWLVIEDQWCAFDFGQAAFQDDWQVLDPAIEAEVCQDFAASGYIQVPQRADLEAEVLPNSDRQTTVLEILSSNARLGIALGDEQQRDYLIDDLWRNLGQDDLPNEVIAMTARALTDVCIRDCVLWKLSSEPIDATMAARLRELVRCVPLGKRAPIATLSAIYAWMMGDGARANISLDIAFEDDPNYELGSLLAMALTNALPPSRWLEMMSSLTYAAVRGGGAPMGNK